MAPLAALLHCSLFRWNFARSIFIPVDRNFTTADINNVDIVLLKFVVNYQKLYGKKYMTFNLHQLQHLAKSVHNWGPLTRFSAFPFKCFNGKIKRYVKKCSWSSSKNF